MYCSIQEAWPDFIKNSPGLTQPSTEFHHNINNQTERFQPTSHNYQSMFNKESRPELVNKTHYINNNQSEHYKQIQSDNYKSNQSDNYKSNQSDNYKPNQSEHFKPNIGCNDFLEHLEECEECRMYISNRFGKSNKLADLLATNPQLKETLMVFLIGILVLMVLNLFYK